MAADNVSLGIFNLTGIPPAPRGVPQIEVTFDIDANGILNVSAKDMATGKEQKITITASTKLSEREKERMIKEAEQFAEQDRKRRKEAEVRNNADSLIYTAEKTKKDLADRLGKEQVERIDRAVADLREARREPHARPYVALSRLTVVGFLASFYKGVYGIWSSLEVPQLSREASVTMPTCTSCSRIIPPGVEATKFPCPSCGEITIWRCSRCRNFGRAYRCPKCGFTGP